jgi:hypothetical protein
MQKQKYFIYLLLLIYSALAAFTIYHFDGTGDNGDSILHYLHARYAPQHPEVYFYHWSKPLYVLLASPLAQFGFIGIKLFNVLLAVGSIHLTFQISKILNQKSPGVAALMLICTPLYYILTFSGLTEILFGFWLCLGLYFYLKEKRITALILFSFLPYTRSEGLIILVVVVLFLLIEKHYRLLPYLMVGSVIYSIAGYFVYHDFLWVFTEIPYSKLSSQYGNGKLTHFVDQLFYVVGPIIYILLIIGIISIVNNAIKSKFNNPSQYIVLAFFVTYFVAHSMFWWLGIFNSMGMKRVMIAVAPMVAILSTAGYDWITNWMKEKNRIAGTVIGVMLILAIIIFPFTHNKAAIHFDRDLGKTNEQKMAQGIADKASSLHQPNSLYLLSNPIFYEYLNLDPFNNQTCKGLSTENLNKVRKGDIVIWDNWFSVIENNVSIEMLDSNSRINLIEKYECEQDGRMVEMRVYEGK